MSVAASLLIGVSSYLVRRIFADTLPVEDFAALYSLVAAGTLAVGIFRFGTAELVLFVLSGMETPSAPGGKRLFTGVCLWNTGVFLLVTLAAGLFFTAGGRPAGIAVELPTLLLFLPFLFLTAFDQLFGNACNALKAFGRQYGVQVLKSALMVVCAVWSCGMLNRAVLAYNVPLLISTAAVLIYLRRFFCPDVWRLRWRTGIKEHAGRCLWLWLFSFSPLIFNELATTILTGVNTPREVAFFNIAIPVAMIIRTFYCVAMVFVPFAGAMINSADYRSLRRYIYAAMAAVAALGVVLIPLFHWGGAWLIALLFGERFAAAAPAAFLLSEAMLTAFHGQLCINTLNTLGRERSSALITVAVALTATAAYFPLSARYGALGAALGALMAAVLWSLLAHAVLMGAIRSRTAAR